MKKNQFFESCSERVQIFDSFFRKKVNSLGHMQKKVQFFLSRIWKKKSVLGVNFEKKIWVIFKRTSILWVMFFFFFQKEFNSLSRFLFKNSLSRFFFLKQKQIFESYSKKFNSVSYLLEKSSIRVIFDKKCSLSHIHTKKKRVQFFDSFAEKKKKIYSLSIFSKKSLVIFKNKINS